MNESIAEITNFTGKPRSDSPVLEQPVPCCNLLPGLRLQEAEATRLANLFKALSHPVRLQIVDLLSRYGGQVCVCDIEQHFSLSQPTISHHLKILRQAGLLDAEQRGVWVYYHTRPDALAELHRLMADLTANPAQRPEGLPA